MPRGEAGDFASREKFAFRPGVDPVNGEKRPLDHTLTHLFGPFPAAPSREFLFPATRTTRQLAGNVAGPPARPAAGHSDCPCPSRGGASATVAQIIRVNPDAKMAGSSWPRRRRRSGLFPRLDCSLESGHRGRNAPNAVLDSRLRGSDDDPMRCTCDIRGFTQRATSGKLATADAFARPRRKGGAIRLLGDEEG